MDTNMTVSIQYYDTEISIANELGLTTKEARQLMKSSGFPLERPFGKLTMRREDFQDYMEKHGLNSSRDKK